MKRKAYQERFFIYKLYDCRDKSMHYVGITRNTLALRLAQHLLCDNSNSDHDAWIQEAGSHNVGIEEIDTAIGWDEARRKEAYWIHCSLDEQEPLTNIIIPGLNGKGYTKIKSLRASILPGKSIRRSDYEHWSVGLQEGSEALTDVDAICHLTGLQRGEVSRLIVITWSKARRGKVQELWGLTPGIIFAGGNGQNTTPPGKEEEPVPPPAARKRKAVSESAAAAVQGITLDLD